MLRVPILFASRCQFIVLRSTAPVSTSVRCAASSASAAPAMEEHLLKAKPISEMPMPRGAVPLLGHVPLLRKHPGKKRLDLFQRCFEELGPIFRLKLPGKINLVVLYDPVACEKVFRNEGQYPVGSSSMAKNMQYLLDNLGLPVPFPFLLDKEWKEQRNIHNKQLRPANVYSYSPGINRATDRLLKSLESARNEEGYVEDIHPYMMAWAMEASAWFSFGADLDLSKEGQESVQFQKAMQGFFGLLGRYTEAIPFYKIYPTPLYNNIKRAVLQVQALGKKYMEQNRWRVDERKKEGGSIEGLSLLEQWMLEGNLTEDEISLLSVGMLAAGTDTTANYATFMLYEMAKYPEVQEKLRRQVISVLGEKGEVDADSLQKIRYMRDIIKETNRLCPLFPIISRELDKDIELMGYVVPAKSKILMMQTMQKSDGLMFKNLQKFDPDRWSGDEDRAHPFRVLPFGFGPRSCFGRRFAEIELKVLLTKICRHFAMTSDEPLTARIPIEFMQSVRPTAPVRIKLTPRT